MPDSYLYEYAVIRVVPRVEREEFMNVGVILYCRDKKFLQARIDFQEERLRCFSGLDEAGLQEINTYLQSFNHICAGGKMGGPIGDYPLAERFRWLTAARSTVVQTSATHPGFSKDPQDTLIHLHRSLVMMDYE
ncbi:Protein of unknown function [bacterium A37T11]|nr:Protein of unknown function [bacterium A37T11]